MTDGTQRLHLGALLGLFLLEEPCECFEELLSFERELRAGTHPWGRWVLHFPGGEGVLGKRHRVHTKRPTERVVGTHRRLWRLTEPAEIGWDVRQRVATRQTGHHRRRRVRL